MSRHVHGVPVNGSATIVTACRDCETREAEVESLRERLHRAGRWMASHDDVCPLDDEGDEIVQGCAEDYLASGASQTEE